VEYVDCDLHVVPVNDLVDHECTRDCWCKPELLAVCEECDGEECWKCNNGLVPLEDLEENCVVVHNAADGRE
jgi:hypothetical protein